MASQAVGFTVQWDVIGGASLIHSVTGRLLEALSDGGVDFYAVFAALQLGNVIQMTTKQEVAVTTTLASKRTGCQSYTSTLLSIGWGHSDIATELARTRAGACALMTIGAFATGSTSWEAALALSSLMEVYGAKPDRLPTIDCLKSMAEYLAPFMSDSGVRNVLEHVVRVSEAKLSSIGHMPLRSSRISSVLKDLGVLHRSAAERHTRVGKSSPPLRAMEDREFLKYIPNLRIDGRDDRHYHRALMGLSFLPITRAKAICKF